MVRVLAIGGGASVGKTMLALEIAQLLHLDRVVHVDDVRGPSFIDVTPDVWKKPAAWLFDALLAETEQLHDAIATEISALRAAGSTTLIEGEGATFVTRSSGPRFLALSRVEQDAVVEMNQAYGSWLRTEAEARHQPWVSSQPWESLAERVREALRL